MTTNIKLKRDTAANWTSNNPVLLEGQTGWEGVPGEIHKAKIGDGVTAWNDLPYSVDSAPVTEVNGQTGVVTLDQTDIGLPNVENTSDMDKPVSVAQQAALDDKADLDSPVFTGNPRVPTAAPGDADTTAANTAFVAAAVAGGAGAAVPVGVIQMWPTAVAPSGWFFCKGDTFDGVANPALAALLGDTFGAHVGDDYYLPDMRDAFPLGASATHPVASEGGAATKALTSANLPPHAHTIAHTHNITHHHSGITAGVGGGGLEWDNTGAFTAGGVDGVVGSGPIPLVTNDFSGSSGGSSAANSGNGPGTSTPVDIRNPFVSLNFIIKAG